MFDSGVDLNTKKVTARDDAISNNEIPNIIRR